MKITYNKNWSIGKARVMGDCYSNPKRQIQQWEETIYYLGYFRLIFTHKMRFI